MTIDTDAPIVEDLREHRAARQPRTPTRRRGTTRKPTGPASKPVAKTPKPGPGTALASWVKMGAVVLGMRAPVHGAILQRQAETLGPLLDKLAAEDEHVRAALTRVAALFGKTGAWGEVGGWAAQTGAAMMIVSGAAPTGLLGMAMSMVAGSLVDAAIDDAASKMAIDQIRATAPDLTEDQIDDAHGQLVGQIRGHLIAEMQERAAMRAAVDVEDQGDADGST